MSEPSMELRSSFQTLHNMQVNNLLQSSNMSLSFYWLFLPKIFYLSQTQISKVKSSSPNDKTHLLTPLSKSNSDLRRIIVLMHFNSLRNHTIHLHNA